MSKNHGNKMEAIGLINGSAADGKSALLATLNTLVQSLVALAANLNNLVQLLQANTSLEQSPELDEEDIPCEHKWRTHLTLIDDGNGEFEFLELICKKCCITRPWLSRLDSKSEDTEDFDLKEEEWDAYRKHCPDEADDWDSRGGEV
jgi:hypothetical protein